jgi:addiction module RelE/StbE family toxin
LTPDKGAGPDRFIQARSDAGHEARLRSLQAGEGVESVASQRPAASVQSTAFAESRWKGFLECHIEPDWLLIYQTDAIRVLLVRTGTHADLFDD